MESEQRYYAIYKPYGFLSQFINNQNTRRNKKLLGLLGDFPEQIMAVGRLDEKSEGLLLLTTDGKFSEFIRSKKIEKEYLVQVDGTITDEALDKLKNGVTIKVNKEDYITKPALAKRIEDISAFPLLYRKEREARHGNMSWISITISEGKFRQIRKMTAAVGFPTLRLVRVRIGAYSLNGMNIEKVNRVNTALFHYTYKSS